MLGKPRKTTCVLVAAALCLNCHSWQLASGPIHEVVPHDSLASDQQQVEVRVYLPHGEHLDLDRAFVANQHLKGITTAGESRSISLDSVTAFKLRRFDVTGTVLLTASIGLFVVLGAAGDCCMTGPVVSVGRQR